ncbi:MAG: PQQ-binding-like beta-propeller repeat protein [Verrucomicrobiales bacterium]
MWMLPFSFPAVNRALTVTAAHLSFAVALAEDWPNYRGPQLDGISREAGLLDSGQAEIAWQTEVGLGYSSPVVAGGRVVVSGHDGEQQDTLFCLDEKNGTVKWKFTYDQPIGDLYFQGGTTGTPTIDGGRVYHVAREGEVFCLDFDDGKVVWKKHLQDDFGYSKPTWGFTGAPLVLGSTLYINAGLSGVALNKNNGGVVWKSEDEEAGYSSPLPLEKGGDQYLIFSSKRFYTCVEQETGEAVWQHRWMTRYGVNAADPVLSGDYIFISSGYGKGAALLEWKGEGKPRKVWQTREMKTQMNAAVLIDGHLYGVDGNENQDGTGLKCLELTSGKTKWLETAVGHGTVVGVQGRLLVLTEEGELQVAPATPSGYEPAFSQQVLEPRVWTVPVFANGTVYCRNASGSLVAVAMSKKS